MKLRPATDADARRVFEWANDPETRANSARTEPIAWPEHEAWFAERLADEDACLYIAETDGGGPAGIVRFQSLGDEAEISINVAPAHRGGGMGTSMIVEACESFFSRDVPTVVAYVKPENLPSQRAFAKAGFRPAGEETVRGARMLRYELRKDVGGFRR